VTLERLALLIILVLGLSQQFRQLRDIGRIARDLLKGERLGHYGTGGVPMTMSSKAARLTAASKPFFKCPNCEALYHIVKVEADPQSDDREITCSVCGGPLPGREAKFVMKYFLLRKPGRIQKWKRT
jgi:hypothetical protein